MKRLAEERGFRATIEHAGADGASVDVVLRNQALAIACEISITTNVEHELANVEKCIGLGFSRVVLISPNARRRERLTKQITARSLSVPVDVIEPEGIVAFLDQFTEEEQPTEKIVRGYKVKVTRQKLSPSEVAAKRKAVAEVIARTMRKGAPPRLLN